MKKLLLIDGNSVLFRSYYSTIYTNALQTQSGVHTNAVFGFINTINKAIKTVNPDALLVAFDAGKPTFRHEMMEEYKGTRKPLDPELIEQMPIDREYLDEAGIVRYEQAGYEADDIIGSCSAAAVDMETYILTGDQDLMQLVNDHTSVMMMKKGTSNPEVFTPDKVLEKYGVTPGQIADLKGLMGDSSDNIPGVKGVGPKSAATLLQKYHDIENTYEHIDELKGALKKKMEAGKEAAFLSKELATIYTQMKLPFDFDDLAVNENNEGKANFFLRYEMKSLLAQLKKNAKAVVTPVKEVTALSLDSGKPAFFLPMGDMKPFMEEKLFGFFLSQNGKAEYISLENAKTDSVFTSFLDNGHLSTWSAKNSWHLLNRNGFKLPEFENDLHLAAFLLYSQATSPEAQLQVLQIELPEPLKDLEKKSLGGFTVERALPIFSAWVEQAPQAMQEALSKLKEEGLEDLYKQVELPLAKILYEMETAGIDIDLQTLQQIGKNYQDILDHLEEQIFEMSGKSFNILSPKQLATVLFDELKLTPTKKRSTAAELLEEIRDEHPIVPLILEYRKYSKIVTTYVDGLQKAAINGKIHTTFNQTIAQTGRLSSSDPNLQNISIKSEEGKEIRKAFVADPGCVLLSADYSQIELRMLAHMADEQFMIQAFMEGVDIHNRTASLIFDIAPDEVDEAQRRIAKTVNFAIIYGQTEYGLSKELDISRLQAKKFIQAYFASYPRIHEFTDSLVEFCEDHGYVQTLLKRRRAIPEIHEKNFMVREAGKRQAMNAPIQGSAADLIKLAMIKVDRAMKEKNLKSKMLLQIHDELIFNVPEDELEIMKKLVAENMDHAMELSVPLEADIHFGTTWFEAK